MTLSYAIDRYTGELARGGRHKSTLTRYRTYLNKLADLYPHHDVEEVTTDMVRRYLDMVTVGKGGTPLDVDTISQRTTIVKKFFEWLRQEGHIQVDPAERIKSPKRKNPVENDRVKVVTESDVKRMLAVAERDLTLKKDVKDRYRAMLCLATLSYTGGRRHAVAQLRIGDYDAFAEPHPTITFHEKGGKTIRKPVPARLAELIRDAALEGLWESEDDYLIPSRSTPRNKERDDRIIYKVVKDVAADAKVDAHVHAMRAAFACYFIDSKPDQLLALKELMGHSDIGTTMIYLRRHNRAQKMAAVVDLDWGEHERESVFQALGVTEKEGFEPSFRSSGSTMRPGMTQDRKGRK